MPALTVFGWLFWSGPGYGHKAQCDVSVLPHLTDADLEKILPRILWGSFGNAGQSCIAVQRIFVHEEHFQTFCKRLVEESRRVVVGDPSDEKTLVGPMISEEAARKAEGQA